MTLKAIISQGFDVTLNCAVSGTLIKQLKSHLYFLEFEALILTSR